MSGIKFEYDVPVFADAPEAGDDEPVYRDTPRYEALDGIRERGYAYDDQERVKGMRCVAAPITTADGRAIAAVSVSVPKSRAREWRFTEETPKLVVRTSNVIGVNLTYS